METQRPLYMPAKAAFPQTETHKRRQSTPDSHALQFFFFSLDYLLILSTVGLLRVSIQLDRCDLYDRMTGESLHQQTRIISCWR